MDTAIKMLVDRNCCNFCLHYNPLKKNGKTYCRGHCRITGQYKQRTDYKCKKHFKDSGQIGLLEGK